MTLHLWLCLCTGKIPPEFGALQLWIKFRGGTTLCTRHAYNSKYIIDNRMFMIQFENGF